MQCEDAGPLLMAILDGELDPEKQQDVEGHVETCPRCQAELEDLQRLKEQMSRVRLREPEPALWDHYWTQVYNRLERSVGWVLFSLGAIILLSIGGWSLIEEVISDPQIGLLLKVGLLATLAGLIVLLVSVARERLFFWRRERYREVER